MGLEPRITTITSAKLDIGSDARDAARDLLTIGTCGKEEAKSNVVRFSLAHVNDMQARYSERIGKHSRYAYVAGALRQQKRDKPNTLVLDAGDDYEKGSFVDLVTHGESTRQIVQTLPIDVRTMGNHDFAYGEGAVARDVRESAHPVLATNLRDLREGGEHIPFARFVRAEVGCVRVGIFGFVTRNYLASDQQTRDPYFGRFESETRYREITERIMAEHRAEVDVMIMLNHMGLGDDMGLGQLPGVDIVVGAHSEDTLKNALPLYRRDGSRSWLTQAGHYARAYGLGDVVVDRARKNVWFESYRIVDVDGSLPVAEDVTALVDSLEREYTPDLHASLVKLPEGISPGRPMSELLWQAVREQFDADGLVVAKDAFWGGLPRGDVTLSRLYESLMVQKQPAGTEGMSALTEVEMELGDLLSLSERAKGPLVDVFAAPQLAAFRGDAQKRSEKVRVYVERRLALHPEVAFFQGVSFPEPRPVGELVDVLRPFLKKRARASDNR